MGEQSARLPLKALPAVLEEKILSLGGNPHLNLYKVLANHPALLSSWIDFAYSLRQNCKTSRQLRELMILRGAQLCQSDYEWFQHEQMARQAGLSQEKIDLVAEWKESDTFDEKEKLVLALMEALINDGGQLTDELNARVKEHFTEAEYLELVMTGSFYAMVPRVLKSLQIPIEK